MYMFDNARLLSEYVNNWDETFVFQCAMSGYIAGIDSYHGNSVEDRRFKFYCCQTYGRFVFSFIFF